MPGGGDSICVCNGTALYPRRYLIVLFGPGTPSVVHLVPQLLRKYVLTHNVADLDVLDF